MDVLFGFTPPRLTTPPEKVERAILRLAERVNAIRPSGLTIYDIQDESARNPNPRPFPFSATYEPLEYARRLMEHTDIPMILYKCVVKHSPEQFARWVEAVEAETQIMGVVLVGGQSSREETHGVSLREAYEIWGDRTRRVQLGGVAIAERHLAAQNEHERIIRKMARGCTFFISQAVYHPDITTQLIGDLTKACAYHARPFPPFYMTLTPCGSAKGFEFMDWLGIYVKEQPKRFILASQNPVQTSVSVVRKMAQDIVNKFPSHPIRFNIESISKKRSEIEAAVRLTEAVKRMTSDE